MADLSTRTELLLAAFYYVHGRPDSAPRDKARLQAAVDGVDVADLSGRFDLQLLTACHRGLICLPVQIGASKTGINEVLTLACADRGAAGSDDAVLRLAVYRQPDLSWQQRADLR